jgi:hypothetical protein
MVAAGCSRPARRERMVSNETARVPTDAHEADVEDIVSRALQAYDRGDLEAARAAGLEVLAREPRDLRILRLLVDIACIEGEQTEAQAHFSALPDRDRVDLVPKCQRYGITLDER